MVMNMLAKQRWEGLHSGRRKEVEGREVEEERGGGRQFASFYRSVCGYYYFHSVRSEATSLRA